MTIEFESGQRNRRVGERSHAFLLRCWQEPDGSLEGEAAWRFSLFRIDNRREPKGFTDLEAVLDYLRQILVENNCSPSEREQS